jgi:ketosteroid isomerase-like protein
MREHASPRRVVERLLTAVAGGPGPELADLYADDAVVELPFAGPAGLRLVGREQIREHFGRASGVPLRLIPERVLLHETTDPEVVIAEYDYRGEATTTGRTFVCANVQIIRVRDGLITSSRDFHDHTAFAAAMGA